MSLDLKKLNLKSEIVTMTFIELEEGEIANEETLSPSPNLKGRSLPKEGKSSSKKHHSSKHKIYTSSDSESSDQDEQARKGWWNKKKLHGSSSQNSSSKSKEDDSEDDSRYIEKPMPDYASLQNKKKKFKKRNNNNKKKNYPPVPHHHHHKSQENENTVSSSSKEKENKHPETKKRNLYPCKFYIAFGKCDDINCHCIHAPLKKEEELRRFIDENEQFFSDAFKNLPKTPMNPTLIPILSRKFPSADPQNTNKSYIPASMPPPKFLSPQLHPQYPIFSPTNLQPLYSFPVPQVISPQQARFPGQPIYANPSIYFEFNMQQNLTYLPQNPQFFSQPPMLIPAAMMNPNFQAETPQVSGSPLQMQSATSVNIFTASKDLQVAPGMIGRRRSSIDTAPGSDTYEVNVNEKGISPDSGQEKEDEVVKKAKTAEKLTRLVELFKAKNPPKEEPKESPKVKAPSENNKEVQKKAEDDMFKQWEEQPKREAVKSKFENGSANDELLKKISSELAQNPTQSGSGNVKDLVNMYLKLSKNLIAENNSVH